MTAVHHGLGGSLESVPNERALKRRMGVQLGDRVWNEELQAVQVAVMGGWELETPMADKLKGYVFCLTGKLKGYVFCLTGKMWTTREEVERAIHASGGSVSRSMTRNAILVQGVVAGEGKSKKQREAEANGRRTISSNDLNAILQGHVTIDDLSLGVSPKQKKSPPAKAKAEPIDRDRHNATVKQVFEDIEAIVFK